MMPEHCKCDQDFLVGKSGHAPFQALRCPWCSFTDTGKHFAQFFPGFHGGPIDIIVNSFWFSHTFLESCFIFCFCLSWNIITEIESLSSHPGCTEGNVGSKSSKFFQSLS